MRFPSSKIQAFWHEIENCTEKSVDSHFRGLMYFEASLDASEFLYELSCSKSFSFFEP